MRKGRKGNEIKRRRRESIICSAPQKRFVREAPVRQRPGRQSLWQGAVHHPHAHKGRRLLRGGLHAGLGRARPRHGQPGHQVRPGQGKLPRGPEAADDVTLTLLLSATTAFRFASTLSVVAPMSSSLTAMLTANAAGTG